MPGYDEEGVIKFSCIHEESGPVVRSHEIIGINHWRERLYLTRLIGQDPERYDGAGYGNVSIRYNQGFLISGTQTGGLRSLTINDYAYVLKTDITGNSVESQGPIKPSSEALTHAMIYEILPWTHCVLHAHEPRIWRSARKLGIPLTDQEVRYGTPEMAEEVRRLERRGDLEKRIFAMGGHQDGIIGFGGSPDEAGEVLMRYLSKARD